MAPRRSISHALSRAVELSLALPAGALIALVWANVAPDSYERLSHALHFSINDIGMVFFFALAAKEVVEATGPGGALHTWRRAALPVAAAAGGMLAPAALYIGIVRLYYDDGLIRGWAIPCATDIAFSYLVARAIFRRHPAIPFLLLLAIADDAIGLVILAVFYPVGDLRIGVGVGILAVALTASFLLRQRRVRSFWPYVLVGGTIAWAGLFVGGLHPALALVPIVPFMPRAPRDPGLFVDAPPQAHDTLSEFEHWWKYPVQGVLLLFGLVNAGVPLNEAGPGTWAVLAAILIGKPLGILLTTALAVAGGLSLPARLQWRDLAVTGVSAGIGFTVALFFATAAFPPGAFLDQTKMGALLSVSAAALAFAVAAVLRVGRFTASAARADL